MDPIHSFLSVATTGSSCAAFSTVALTQEEEGSSSCTARPPNQPTAPTHSSSITIAIANAASSVSSRARVATGGVVIEGHFAMDLL